jgi:hypothetical protein
VDEEASWGEEAGGDVEGEGRGLVERRRGLACGLEGLEDVDRRLGALLEERLERVALLVRIREWSGYGYGTPSTGSSKR